MKDPTATTVQKTARTVGQTLATVQHLFDLSIGWGFRKLKNIEATGETQKKKSGCLHTPVKIALSVLSFVGRTGDAYYEWYGKMKEKGSR
ncbi:MAG: hypothetical protein V1926_03520 [Candidatus Peregrinibacteria bacterium]